MHRTLVGHSYGATVAAMAASEATAPIAEDYVSVGGIGAGVYHASELNVDQVWATELNSDRLADLGVHGRDPTDTRFGANVFQSDSGPGVPITSTDHSAPFDDVPGNVGLRNIATIINGGNPEIVDRVPVGNPSLPGADYDPPI